MRNTALNDISGALFLKETKVKEESSLFAIQTTINHSEDDHLGRIGRDFFSNKNLFLDLGNHTFIVCSHLKNLRKNGYETKNLYPLPFILKDIGIVFEFNTDFRTKILLLDTSTTYTFLRNDLSEFNSFTSSKFSIGSTDFDPMKLRHLNINSLIDQIDGTLGMDFLLTHPIYLDFSNNTAYVDKTS